MKFVLNGPNSKFRNYYALIKLTDYELKKLPHEKQFASQLKATISVRLLDCNITTY